MPPDDRSGVSLCLIRTLVLSADGQDKCQALDTLRPALCNEEDILPSALDYPVHWKTADHPAPDLLFHRLWYQKERPLPAASFNQTFQHRTLITEIYYYNMIVSFSERFRLRDRYVIHNHLLSKRLIGHFLNLYRVSDNTAPISPFSRMLCTSALVSTPLITGMPAFAAASENVISDS